jgi:hypothetical protein
MSRRCRADAGLLACFHSRSRRLSCCGDLIAALLLRRSSGGDRPLQPAGSESGRSHVRHTPLGARLGDANAPFPPTPRWQDDISLPLITAGLTIARPARIDAFNYSIPSLSHCPISRGVVASTRSSRPRHLVARSVPRWKHSNRSNNRCTVNYAMPRGGRSCQVATLYGTCATYEERIARHRSG